MPRRVSLSDGIAMSEQVRWQVWGCHVIRSQVMFSQFLMPLPVLDQGNRLSVLVGGDAEYEILFYFLYDSDDRHRRHWSAKTIL